MFKVSLLPASYRKQLENKAKKELLEKVALLVLICLLIIFGGVFAKGQILSAKLKNIEHENTKLEQQFPALQRYQSIYDDLKSTRGMMESILPKNKDAVSFIAMLSNITPDYIEVKDIRLENWFTSGICTMQCICMDYSDLKDYQAILQSEEVRKVIQDVQISGITHQTGEDGDKSVSFTVALSLSGNVQAPADAPQVNNAEPTSKPVENASQSTTTTAPATTDNTAEPTTEKEADAETSSNAEGSSAQADAEAKQDETVES